jgi:hypothetical protein
MKPTAVLAVFLGLVAASPRSALAADAGRAEVIFDHPERFTDVKDQTDPTDKGRQAILKELSDFIVREASHRVPAGYKLTVIFGDIDLAGDFEPWRGPQFDSVRIIKPIYPPDLKFSYMVTDIAGRMVAEGDENIRDLAFDLRSPLDEHDPLRYEKGMIADWMRARMREVQTSRS